MHLRHLSLTNFRNYRQQELELAPGMVLLLGANAQGKTNLLEAIFLLATGRSERASVDADYIAWDVRGEAQPFARVAGVAARADGDASIEITIVGREAAGGRLIASKRFRLNGVAKRGADVTGALKAVLFTTDDMELVGGAPSGRRRYLDVMLSQASRAYGRALQRYTKVLAQRNALLKRIQEGAAGRGELGYWDEELAREGGAIVHARGIAVTELAVDAAALHARLSGERERLDVRYEPRTGDGPPAAKTAEEIAAALLAQLGATQGRDIGAGLTLSGPHRDDVALTLDGQRAADFASRGQQRTAALALRLAEASLLEARSGERPLLLLDDVLSELDEARRAGVLREVRADQVMISSADPDRFGGESPVGAQVFRVDAGHVERWH